MLLFPLLVGALRASGTVATAEGDANNSSAAACSDLIDDNRLFSGFLVVYVLLPERSPVIVT